jgi:TIR domain-containing protein
VTRESQFVLPGEIEHYLSVLSKLYKKVGQRDKLELIVNAQVRVHEEWDYDNWNGGTYGHAVYLIVPENVYVGSFESREILQTAICSDLNKLHHESNEHFAAVFVEMQKVVDADWRQESGVLRAGRPPVSKTAVTRIWGARGYRVFLSHKAEVKKKTAQIKEHLKPFGAMCFVAHEDIHPTKAWQDEIEKALMSMDAFVALLTDKFHDSLWTDQEVGFAVARGVPIIAVKLEHDPYGFIGKFQALKCDWTEAALEVAKLLINETRMLDAYIASLTRCRSFDEGNVLAQVLPEIENMTVGQADLAMGAFNANFELQGSFGFSGTRPGSYGKGLAFHLTRSSGRKYIMNDDLKIVKGSGK